MTNLTMLNVIKLREKIHQIGLAATMILMVSLTMILLIASASASPLGSITVKGKFEYVDESGVNQPMRQVKVYLMDDDKWEGWPFDEQVAWQYTNNNGEYSFTVINDDGYGQNGRDPYIKVESSNVAAIVKSPLYGIYTLTLPKVGNNLPDNSVWDYGTASPVSNNEAWQILDAVLAERNFIKGPTGWERPTRVTINWPSGLVPLCYGDTIHLPLKIIWSWDRLTVYHLYGLSVLYTLYGNRFPVGWVGPLPPHRVVFESSGTVALVEGWAGFLQAAVDDNPNNLIDISGGNIETNNWFNFVDAGQMDGNIIEGSVASVFWDIFDPANDDPLSLNFAPIFSIIKDFKPTDINAFWNWWKYRYPAYAGPLATTAWQLGIDWDIFPPTGSIVINSGDTYTTSPSVTLTVSASDFGSGVAYMRFSNWPNPDFWGTWFPWVWSDWQPYATSTSWTLLNGDGIKTVTAQFKDVKGLITTSPLPADSIILDTVVPTGSIVINGDATYTTSPVVTLTLSYFDDTSGVLQVRYSNDGFTWTSWLPPTTTKAWTLSAGDGTKTVYYQIQDNAGWVSATYIDTIILDSTPPTGSIIINGGDTYTNSPVVTLTLTYDDALSGVMQVRFRNAGTSWGPWEPPTPTRTWTLLPPDGLKTVEYQIQDNAGLLTIVSDSIVLDTVPPSTTASHANPSSLATLFPTDGISGILATYYRIDGGPWFLYGGAIAIPAPSPYSHTIEYYSVDNAGNVENPKQLIVHYLTVDSNIAITLGNDGWYTDGYTAWTPTAPDTYWIGTDMFGFQTWKKDTVAVSGNPISIVMSGPHWAKAGYLGFQVTGYKSGDTLYLTMRIRSEISTTVNLQIYIDGPDSNDITIDGGSLSLIGGIDLMAPTTVSLPGDLPSGGYTVYLRLIDPTSGSVRARTQMSFSV